VGGGRGWTYTLSESCRLLRRPRVGMVKPGGSSVNYNYKKHTYVADMDLLKLVPRITYSHFSHFS